MKKTLALLTIMTVFLLSACNRNKKIIEDAMRSIGSQSTYVAVLPEPNSLWPLAIILGIILLLAVVGLAWYVIYNKNNEKNQKAAPRRRVTKVYYPQPLHPGDQHQSVTYAPTQAHPQYPPEHVPVQPPWKRT